MTSSAAPISSAVLASKIDWNVLVPLSEAARHLQQTPRHLRRRCAEELADRGMAYHLRRPTGGQPGWFIDRRFYEQIAPAKNRIPENFRRYTAKQQTDALARRACVEDFREMRCHESRPQSQWIGSFVEQIRKLHPSLKISRTSLYRWDKDYRRPDDLMRLVSKAGGNQQGKGDVACWDFFAQLYLTENCLSISHCWDQVRDYARDEDLEWCSKRYCELQVKKRFPPEMAMQHREPARWRSTSAPYNEQDPEHYGANECWVADHSQLDFWCWFGNQLVRPTVTSFQDWKTRKIVGHVLCVKPDSSTVLAALGRGLKTSDAGPPRFAHLDNGKDFAAYVFHNATKTERRKEKMLEKGYADESFFTGIYRMAGIKASFSLPYNPNGKPRQERFYGYMHERFCKTFASYTGRNTVTRPERLDKVLKRPSMIPTFEEILPRFDKFVEGFNRRSEHQVEDLVDHRDRKRLSPDEAMARWCTTKRQYIDPGVLDYFTQQWHRPVAVGRNGVSLRLWGMTIRYGQFAPELRRFKNGGGKVVATYDPTDVRSVTLLDMNGAFLCHASGNKIGGLSGAVGKQRIKELMSEQRLYRKAQKQKATITREFESAEERLAQQPYNDKPTPNYDAIQPVQTPIDGVSKAVQRDTVRRKHLAAGAEHIELDDLDALDDVIGAIHSGGFAQGPGGVSMESELGDLGFELGDGLEETYGDVAGVIGELIDFDNDTDVDDPGEPDPPILEEL